MNQSINKSTIFNFSKQGIEYFLAAYFAGAMNIGGQP